jgi:hypothetical protein
MGLFDTLENEAEAIGAKAGLSPQQVQSISATIQSKLGQGTSQRQALEADAAEHGLPVEKIEELLGHAGGSGNLMGELSGLAGGFLKS